MLYDLLKMLVSVCFNLLNKLLGGRLPPFGTASVIVEQDNRYLVVELPRGRLAFPGGFMNWRETPAQAAQREGKEETGLDLHIGHLINIYPRASTSFFSMSAICFFYHGKVTGGKLRNNIEGKPRWLTEDELRARIDGNLVKILEDYLRFRQIHQNSTISESSTAFVNP
jgi:ADP-ribose pyrophosphatase YjhB (NUDIX family)